MTGAPAGTAPWRPVTDGLSVAIRVTPRAGRDAVTGIEMRPDGRCVLLVKLRAAPADNAANDAVIALFSDVCDVPRRNIRIASGLSARLKTLALTGDSAALARALETAVATAR